MEKAAAQKPQKKKPVRKPARRYTVRVYEEETARKLEDLAESAGYREMSVFFVETPLLNLENSLTPWELQALEILTFQLGVQVKVVEAALKKLKRDYDAPVREALALVESIIGEAPSPRKQKKRGRRR